MITFVPEPHLLDSPRGRDWLPAPYSTPTAPPPAEADVVIVGAGPAGLAVASALWHLGVRDVALLDREGRPCGRFFDRVDVLGQRVLRSPYEHHPGVEGYRDCELLDFARLHWSRLTPVERREIRMAQAGHRSVVPVDVFEAYCEHVASLHHVDRRTWRASVREVRPTADGVTVRGDGFAVTAPYTVLCLGEERRPAPFDWWDGEATPRNVSYWDEPVPQDAQRLVVIGSGLSAAHLITNALNDGKRVHWVLRAPQERYQCADVNASFFRAEGRARFDGTSWEDRRILMGGQRRASVMFEFRPLLQRAEADGRLTVHRGRSVTAVAPGRAGRAAVRLSGGAEVIGDHVVLALGTTVSNGEQLLPRGIPSPRDGWPDLDERTLAYRNAPRVFAVGAAAGMVLGPAARNIDGHRVATARVATAVAARLEASAGLRRTEDRVAARV
ncbi:lysine N(6)-hydroxylase/L-ornithine N(5)-oxygenase family protein [Streptomyces sp. NBC_00654]|uniref:FAD-dependent oxidoreductase n=1 Tax=Streptomyces sp. NBC_00654 TaxID=2975799 RepID=UPI00225298B1|nr:FAD-dependent oxidoreductase [Streptomyces sp. NBC_00654]MCX4967722.1 lysine N(6)-hydroxylase/L-ornithine N(5)-oxygenase family protein [Streptomyces sp. NBC_00654]